MSLNALLANHEGVAEALVPEYIQDATEDVRRRIKALKKLHLKTVNIQADFYKRVHELETEFRERYDQVNKQRAEIVNGNYEPAENESDAKIFYWMDEDQEKKFEESAPVAGGDDQAKPKGIPGFWFNALRNTPSVADMISDGDEPILRYLTDITVAQTNDPPAFTLNFHFAENPYFKNSVLTKYYKLSIGPNGIEDEICYDGPTIVATKGCTIDWHAGKNITEKVVKKKPKKGANAGRTQTKVVPNESFFRFFSPEQQEISKDMDDDDAEMINADFEAGQMIRDSLVDSAVLYYTAEATEDEDYDFGAPEDFDGEGSGDEE